ncbi:hypothetical protein CPB85DRAFT_1427490 [Mucidula mucida]|nr:hypothetical protein CPB85DRAFT_1427490 [Mucidula mucida]
MSETISVGIVGAGISGLASAYHLLKTAKRTGKLVKVVLYDRNPSPGGTWSSASVYDGLITNNAWTQMLLDDDGEAERMFQEDPSVGAGPGGFRATGTGMIQVMSHAERQVAALGGDLQSSTTVISAAQADGPGSPWIVISKRKNSAAVTHTYDKLVVCTGSFSSPVVPSFAAPFLVPDERPIEDPFLPFAIHTARLSDPTVQTALYSKSREIVVIGASKSALDAAERLALNGYRVTLILRNPPYLAPPSARDPKTGAPASAAGSVGTRLKTSHTPYFKDPVTGLRSTGNWVSSLFRSLLHRTWLGAFIHRHLIASSTNVFATWGGWNFPLTCDMRPVVDLMWSESSMFPGPESLPSLIQEGKIQLVKGTVIDMEKSPVIDEKGDGYRLSIRLEDDKTVTEKVAQVVIFGTGWNTGVYPFFSPALVEELGLPISYADKTPERETGFVDLDAQSLKELLRDQKTMAKPPLQWDKPNYSARQAGRTPVQVAPYRLYRLMVPLSHLEYRDFGIIGVPTSKANHVVCMVQAHWVADYLLNTLPTPLPSLAVAKTEISLQSVWSRRLFGPAHGKMGQWIGALWIEYSGRLCIDMGVPADGMGLTGVVDSRTYDLEEKRARRDGARRLNV